MRRPVTFVVLAASALLVGCGLLIGASDDPYVDPTIPGADAGDEGDEGGTAAEAGNDAEIDADVEDAGEEPDA